MKKTMTKIVLLAGLAAFILGGAAAFKEMKDSVSGMKKADRYVKEYNSLHDNLTKVSKEL